MKSVSDQLPNLVVLDVMLPDVTGLELLRTLRSDPRTRDLPIVLYTAVGDEHIRAEALSLGTPDVVLKGGGWAELLRHLSKHLTPKVNKPV
jgi:CheY-like chemotaxis protein